jgi:hypothetical protein
MAFLNPGLKPYDPFTHAAAGATILRAMPAAKAAR